MAYEDGVTDAAVRLARASLIPCAMTARKGDKDIMKFIKILKPTYDRQHDEVLINVEEIQTITTREHGSDQRTKIVLKSGLELFTERTQSDLLAHSIDAW